VRIAERFVCDRFVAEEVPGGILYRKQEPWERRFHGRRNCKKCGDKLLGGRGALCYKCVSKEEFLSDTESKGETRTKE